MFYTERILNISRIKLTISNAQQSTFKSFNARYLRFQYFQIFLFKLRNYLTMQVKTSSVQEKKKRKEKRKEVHRSNIHEKKKNLEARRQNEISIDKYRGGKTVDNTAHADFSIKIKTRDGFFCFCFTYVFRASGHLKIILAKEQQYLLLYSAANA